MPVPTQLSKTEKEELSNLESIKAMDRTPKQNNRMQELYDKIPEANKNTFKSSHFDEPNILAHVRFNEREVNGERVLFIEEFQSDFSQSLKKKEDEFKKLLKENPEKVLDMFKKSGKLEALCP